jgi:hypothetical protein
MEEAKISHKEYCQLPFHYQGWLQTAKKEDYFERNAGQLSNRNKKT